MPGLVVRLSAPSLEMRVGTWFESEAECSWSVNDTEFS